MTRLLAFAALALFAFACQSQTAWPGYIHSLKPDHSESPVPAVLPAGVEILPPAADLPPQRARWSGRWHGWACFGRVCDVKVAVERVGTDAATVAYAGATATSSNAFRGEARFVGEELHLRLHTGSLLVLRLRADGDMEMSLWRPDTQLLSAGVLTQRPLGPAPRRTVERVATSWTHEGQPVSLVLVTYRPDPGTGPWPTLVVNHGSTGEGNQPGLFPIVFTDPDVVRYFTQRGWQVVFPQRRGRGGSGGLYDEGFAPDRSRYSCDPVHALPGFERAMEDLEVVMQHVLARPDVDARRVVLSGVSRGGVLAAAYAGRHPQQVQGVVNFVGGWVGDRCRQVAQVNPVLFRRAAAYPRPMLWLYGSGDAFYSMEHSRANFEAFRASGGQGRFVAYELPPGHDGHAISGRPDLWEADVQAYLRELGLP